MSQLRKLTARSVIASTLLGMRRPRLPTLILVRSCELFGIAEGTTRVAISRMIAAGELVADEGGYRLAGALLGRQVRQDLSRRGDVRNWRGKWRTAVVVAGNRSAGDRGALREAAGVVRLAELREGVWVRPDNLPAGMLAGAESTIVDQCRVLVARLADGDDAELAASLWDLDGWADRAEELRAELATTVADLQAGRLNALAPGFVASAAVLRHLQADPLLPRSLLPARWPGAALRDDYERYDTAFTALWRSWYRDQR